MCVYVTCNTTRLHHRNHQKKDDIENEWIEQNNINRDDDIVNISNVNMICQKKHKAEQRNQRDDNNRWQAGL